ncbi:MAG: hypothetical protein P4L84_13890 [Isosphaeraceae bacterium]|nr:hypothetical protein [Isosphaeraceae bacterium]
MPFDAQSHAQHGDPSSTESFDEWAESTISALADLVDALRAELTALHHKVRHLERGAGCGLFHPSDLLEDAR